MAKATKAQKARDLEQFLKGTATATVVLLQNKRPHARKQIIDGVVRKVTNRGISREALVQEIERLEKVASRRKEYRARNKAA